MLPGYGLCSSLLYPSNYLVYLEVNTEITGTSASRTVISSVSGTGAKVFAYPLNGFNFAPRAQILLTTTTELSMIPASTGSAIPTSVTQTSDSSQPSVTGFPSSSNPFQDVGRMKGSGISTGAAIGLGSGAVIGLIGLIAFVAFCFSKRKRRRAMEHRRRQMINKKESFRNLENGHGNWEVNTKSALVVELDSNDNEKPSEMSNVAEARELSSQTSPLELDGERPTAPNERSEKDNRNVVKRESVERHEI
jgi:hypothetical protein